MHGETNNSPRQAPFTVRLATISHMAASAATSTRPKPLKKLKFKACPRRSVANAYTPNGKVNPHQPRLKGIPPRK
ncbi:hypothetical protein D3C76_1401260 [compost metagenome]